MLTRILVFLDCFTVFPMTVKKVISQKSDGDQFTAASPTPNWGGMVMFSVSDAIIEAYLESVK